MTSYNSQSPHSRKSTLRMK